MIRPLLAGALAGCLLAAPAAHARDQAPEFDPQHLSPSGQVAQAAFPAFDRNGDGAITPAEFDLGLERVFASWDRDGDTYLVPRDLPTPALAVLADANQDLLVERHEFFMPMLRLRGRMDANRDRLLTAAEWRAFLESQYTPPKNEDDGSSTR